MARFARTDRFGNSYILVKCKDNGKGFPKGYAEIGGSLYRIEPSPAQKEGVMEWVKITKCKKRSYSDRVPF